VSSDSSGAIAGWYGKLPSLGDFASRRLSDEFIRTWDAWLQDVLQATRGALGQGWLDRYLTMPIWRFVLLPGLVGPTGWAGVLMPSVDRVGRQFPLTLAVSLPSYAGAAHAVFRGGEWLAGLEGVALSALDPTRGPDDFDRALADHAFTSPQIEELDESAGVLRRLSSAGAFEILAETEALRAWSRQGGWSGLWWTQGRVDGDPLMLTCAKLPAAEEFGWLLESRSPSGPDLGAGGPPTRAES
jgi:type VI secretion system protein ImpM